MNISKHKFLYAFIGYLIIFFLIMLSTNLDAFEIGLLLIPLFVEVGDYNKSKTFVRAVIEIVICMILFFILNWKFDLLHIILALSGGVIAIIGFYLLRLFVTKKDPVQAEQE